MSFSSRMRAQQNRSNPQPKPKPKPQAPPSTQQKPPQSNNQQPLRRQPQHPKPKPKQKSLPTKITAVQIEGLVLLKIIKHCGEYSTQKQAVSGKLLGLPTDHKTVEITNCFPVPSTKFTESNESYENDKKKRQKVQNKANQYAKDMIRLMTRIREDNLQVGFYRSALNGAFLTSQTISAAYKHQIESASSVTIIYDPTASIKGRLVIRAFRLTDKFMKFYEKHEFGPTAMSKGDISASDIFKELDVKIHNSHLVHAFLYEIAQLPPQKSLTNGYDRLHHSHDDSLMVHLKQLSTSIDAYGDQTQSFRSYYSKSSKNKSKKEDYLAKFREENMKLKSRGQKPRPMVNIDKLFPPEPEPDRMESVTLTAQMNEYCQEVETSIMQGLVKLW
eukprot:895789_1